MPEAGFTTKGAKGAKSRISVSGVATSRSAKDLSDASNRQPMPPLRSRCLSASSAAPSGTSGWMFPGGAMGDACGGGAAVRSVMPSSGVAAVVKWQTQGT